MQEPIFKTSMFGSEVEVYPTHVAYRQFLKKVFVPLNQIASVRRSMAGVQRVVLETTGGKKIKLLA